MATSPITITALTATPTVRGNKLAATVSATGPAANIPSLMLANVQFYASTTNDFTTASQVGEGNPDFVHAGLIEEQTYYYWADARDVSGNVGAVFPVSPTAGVACKAIGQSGLAFGLANGKLLVTHNSPSSNQLTIAIKTVSGNDPSSDDPILIAFPTNDVGVGAYVPRSITSALSLTITSGSTLGQTGLPFRLWIILFDDSGTLRLGAVCCSNGNGFIYPLSADGVASATAEGGAGAADTLGVIYAAVAITAKPFRILAYANWESGLTAGAWAAAPTRVRLFGPGSPKPGDVVQELSTPNAGAGLGGTTTVPLDNTIPQSTEGNGTQFGVQITPVSAINIIEFDVVFNLTYSVASPIIGAMFRDSQASAFAACWCYVGAADETQQLVFRHRVAAGDAAQRTYNYRVGGSNAGTLRIGGTSGGAQLGGVLLNHHGLKELMG